MPLALASRATQTNSAILRTKMMMGIARKVLHMAQPATCEAASEDCANAGRNKTLSAAMEQGIDLIFMPDRKTLSQRMERLELFKGEGDQGAAGGEGVGR